MVEKQVKQNSNDAGSEENDGGDSDVGGEEDDESIEDAGKL